MSRPVRVRTDDTIFMAHGLWRLTPEDGWDRQPLEGGGGRFLLSGDFFLHRRTDLSDALAIDRATAARLGDSDLVLRAWERWGDRALDRLEGWFAFILVDRERRAVTIATDCWWHRTAYVSVVDGVVAVASGLPDLLAIADVPRDLGIGYLGAFVAELPFLEEETPYRAIRRVAAGTVVTVGPDGEPRSRRYWQPDASRRLRLGSDGEYVEAARDLIDRSVRAASRGAGTVAATLSSGLDSACVVESASRQREGRSVVAFTLAPEEGAERVGSAPIDESAAAARHAARWPGVEHRVIRFPATAGEIWERGEAWFVEAGVPTRNVNAHAGYQGLFAAVRDLGETAVLNGTGGNHGFSFDGIAALTQWTSEGRVLTALREALAIPAGETPSWPDRARGIWRRMGAPFAPSWARRLVDRARGRRGWPPVLRQTLLNPGMVDRLGVAEALAERGYTLHAEPPGDAGCSRVIGQYRNFRWARADQMVAHRRRHGVEQRSPLMCPELHQFCLSIPLEQFLSRGRTRWLARRVLADVLPESAMRVREAPRQGGDRIATLRANRDHYLDALAEVERVSLARELLDLPRLRRLLTDWPAADDPRDFDRDGAYGRAIAAALHVGRFIRWAEGGNR